MAKIITTGKVAAVSFNVAGKQTEHTVTMQMQPLVITYGDGTTREIDLTKLSTEILQMAMVHGLRQKLGDAAAIARNTETGASATIADKIAAVQEVADRLVAGAWNKTERSGGAGKTTLLAEALAAMTKKPIEEMVAFLAEKTDEEKKALRANPRVQAEIAKIEAQRAAAKAKASGIDTKDLLAGLGL